MSPGSSQPSPARSRYNADQAYFNQILSTLPESCQKLWEEHSEIMNSAPGSARKHQAWEGGYRDHLIETFVLAEDLYQSLSQRRGLDFDLSEVHLVLFLHDLEKPFKYTETALFADAPNLAKEDAHAFKERLMQEYQITLTPEQDNALQYIHGEGEDYQAQRVMGPLASICHCCDLLSARLWYDQPQRSGSLLS